MSDWDTIAAIEKAITEKYGEDAVTNPKSLWTPEKELDYIEQVKECAALEKKKNENISITEQNGFLIKKKLVTSSSQDVCKVRECAKYSRNARDDVYILKYECCFECYIKYVDGREDLWEERKKVICYG